MPLTWSPNDGEVPEGFSLPRARDDLEALERELAPATPKEFVVEIDPLIRFGRVFGLPAKADEVARTYLEHLADLPPLALRESVRRVLRDWRDGFRLPMPGDIRAGLSGEYHRALSRRYCLRRAIEMARHQRPPEPRASPEEIQAFVEATRRGLKA